MSVTNKEVMACLEQMPPDMKLRVIEKIETELGMTIPEYKAKQIKAAEALIADIKVNPDEYTTVKYNQKKDETVGHFAIPSELEQEFERMRRFIGYRTSMIYNTDGSVEEHHGATYDEFLKDMKLN